MNTTSLLFPSNKVADIERSIASALHGLYPEGEIRSITRILFEEYLGWTLTQMLTNRNGTINQSDLLKFHWAVERLKNAEPVQYIVGHTTFCGLTIEVNPTVLIPRPETEQMVTETINHTSIAPRTVADLCTGSGCIAIALKKKYPSAQVMAVDISEAALATARTNALLNGTEIEFLKADLLQPKSLSILPCTEFDLIVSNPPYVLDSERTDMHRNVLDHEPHTALFVPDCDTLKFYKPIISFAAHRLSPCGTLVLEINEREGENICNHLLSNSLSPTLHRDFNGKPRWITAARG